VKVVTLKTAPNPNDALDVLEGLKKDILDGKVVAFFAAAVGNDDDTYAYISATKNVTQLKLIGAMSHALFMVHSGEPDDEL